MNPIAALAGVRTVVGASAWLAPNFSGKLFGLDPDANPQAAYLARLFGIRDIALAAGTQNSNGAARKLWLQAGLACDAADAAAAMLAGRNGTLPKVSVVLTAGAAVAALGLGVMALQEPAQTT
jgi:hypothetical protein